GGIHSEYNFHSLARLISINFKGFSCLNRRYKCFNIFCMQLKRDRCGVCRTPCTFFCCVLGTDPFVIFCFSSELPNLNAVIFQYSRSPGSGYFYATGSPGKRSCRAIYGTEGFISELQNSSSSILGFYIVTKRGGICV